MVREPFTTLVTKAMKQFLNDQVNERLKKALGSPSVAQNDEAALAASVSSASVADADLAAADASRQPWRNLRAIRSSAPSCAAR